MEESRFVKVVGLAVLIVSSSLNILEAKIDVEPAIQIAAPVEPLCQDISLQETRFWQKPENIAENVMVISSKDLEKLPADNLAEVLRYYSGITIDTRSGFGHDGTFGMHGAEPRNVRIMVDGITFNNNSSGQMIVSSIPVGNIKQIEIVKGAVSSRWGSALGGIINVVTKDTGTSIVPHGQIGLSLAEYNTEQYFTDVAGGKGRFGYHVYGEHFKSDGLRDDDDVTKKNATAKVSYSFDSVKLQAQAGYLHGDKSDGVTPFFDYYKQNNYTRFAKFQADYVYDDSLRFLSDIKLINQMERNYDFPTLSGRNEFHDKTWGISLETVKKLREVDVLSAGLEFEYNVLETLKTKTSSNQHKTGVFAAYNYNWEIISVNAGLRYDANEAYKDQLSPSLGIVVDVPQLRETRFRFSFARGYHAPPLLWLYYDNSNYKSSPNLRPERSWNWEMGLETQPLEFFKARLNVYLHDVSDYLVRKYDGTKNYYVNEDRYRKTGIELETRFKLAERFFLRASGNINDTRDNDDKKVYSGAERNGVNIGAFYEAPFGTHFSLLGVYERTKVWAQRHEENFIWDLKLAHKYKLTDSYAVEGKFAVHNLFNSAYWQDDFFPNPGRYVEAGLTLHF